MVARRLQHGHMSKRILIIQGHPDNTGPVHLCHTLAAAYMDGAERAGHEVKAIDVAELDFPLLRSAKAWENDPVPPSLKAAQDAVGWCEHLVLFFPLWLGDMPAVLKGFLEQIARPGFALSYGGADGMPVKLLKGRSARIVVTMGMPAAVYRWYFRAHSVKSLERNILGFVGFEPVHETLIGGVQQLGSTDVDKWRRKFGQMGARAE